MDSPMGANVLDLFHRTRDWHRLEDHECDEMCSHFTVVSSYRETMELRSDNKPKIVIAGSGMLTGGRMLNYLETQAQNPNNTCCSWATRPKAPAEENYWKEKKN